MYAQKHASIVSVRKRTFLFAHDSSHSDISFLSCREVLISIIPKAHSPAWMYSRLLSMIFVLYTCLYPKQPAVWPSDQIHPTYTWHTSKFQDCRTMNVPDIIVVSCLWREHLSPSKLSLSCPCKTYLSSVSHLAKESPWEIAGLCLIGSHVHSCMCICAPLVIPRKMRRLSLLRAL